jgi:alkylation response protein AidB-like acyl-CoA dehydrogenase
MPKTAEQFRADVRAWFEENCPESMRTPAPPEEDVWGGRNPVFVNPDSKVWFERMLAKGWIAPTWPTEYGGGGLSEAEGRIVFEEQSRMGCRMPLKSLGLWLFGPVLLEYGTPEQRAHFAPKIIRGELRWCQGYSEPGAGSDLASLQMRAVRDGDHYVLDGQKVWTSHANKADMMFCLVRTDPDVPKRDGISFILVDMADPGVTARPIELISGSSPFCETFFDNVRVPAFNMIGGENRGWTIAKALLGHERAFIAAMRDVAAEETETLADIARRCLGVDDDGKVSDRVYRDRLAQAELDFLCNKLTLRRSKERVESGLGPGPEASMAKYYGTELNKRRKQLRVELAGYRGVGWGGGDAFTADEDTYTREWLRSRANSIEGGTSEIQLNIIAKRVLGLPD